MSGKKLKAVANNPVIQIRLRSKTWTPKVPLISKEVIIYLSYQSYAQTVLCVRWQVPESLIYDNSKYLNGYSIAPHGRLGPLKRNDREGIQNETPHFENTKSVQTNKLPTDREL